MFDISRMDLMWVSFYSIGFMILSIILVYLSRFKFKNKIISGITMFLAVVSLIFAGIFMIVVLGGSSHA
ncbi:MULTISPECIES: DUF2768 domain-containing protein [Mammaliicoccus]|uniref:DUF2768 domain-containing protein n=1 Tax=Mammaliicoccus fleurettii TaxID=150056 RepID=A0ABS5MKF6_9STAP|nr:MULTISPECIES: DUF2768 domain-containing protein [Mammaliicoccus]HCN59711.1 DUF2768 domain-containing protein [Staphylococcus sp.]MBL0846130.1 DUF2768 domain-containing protein [Mammaliicoccus fleurettii]MBO3062507.1 DUF2768 domain-containing protein [Mammaliicoccus fleurettii]MBS3671269.1 DUF2768 domain-containing protein [Mammaliicoccus fleurettii]MBS3696357.1 DUF2768 domain-containing protein [Mammaliicoccus fleurettii]